MVYALDAEARSAKHAVFMESMLVGRAFGAGMAAAAFTRFGWIGLCVSGGLSGAAAFALSIQRRLDRRLVELRIF